MNQYQTIQTILRVADYCGYGLLILCALPFFLPKFLYLLPLILAVILNVILVANNYWLGKILRKAKANNAKKYRLKRHRQRLIAIGSKAMPGAKSHPRHSGKLD